MRTICAFILWLVFCFAAHAQQAEVKEQPKAAPSNLIYVIGGVKQPLAIELNQEIDLLQALDEAGGAVYKKSIIHVYRLDGEHSCLNFRNRIIVKIDLVRLKKGEVDNLMLKPCDIIEVSYPPSKWPVHNDFITAIPSPKDI